MNKEIKYGIVLQYLQMGLSILINLIYTPIMIRILGNSEYGIYNLASSIIAYLSILSLGFGASYLRYYSKYKQSNEKEAISKLNGLYLTVFSIIGIIALVAGLFISFNVSIFFNETYSVADMHIAKVLMILLSINLAISFPASLFISYITSHEKFIFQKIVNIGKTVLSPCLAIAFLYMGYGSIGMAIVTTVVSIIIDIVNVIYCFKKLDMKITIGKPDWPLFKDIAIFSSFLAINQIIDQLNWQTDKVILGKMINSYAVAIYAVAATINTLYMNFSTAISSVFAPKIHEIVNKKEDDMDEKLTQLFINVGRVQYMILGLVATGVIFFGKYFLKIWAGEEFVEAYPTLLLLLIPATVALCQNIGIEIQRAKNMHKFRSIAYLIMAILNILISIWFTSMWGMIGCAIGTAISTIVGNGLIMDIYYHKKLKINIILFWKNIASVSIAFIIPAIFGVAVYNLNYNNILHFALCIVVYTTLYLSSIYFVGMNRIEKSYINRKLRQVISKLHLYKGREGNI